MKSLRRTVYTPTNLNHNILHRLREDDDSLVRIIFSSRDLGSRGVNVLAQALWTNSHLKDLDLSSNSVGPEGANYMSILLQHQARNMIAGNGGIRTLMLGDNNLGDDGVGDIADALDKNIMFETLWIDDNRIGAAGLAILAEALRRNTQLKRLHLQHNSFQSLSSLITCTLDKRSLRSVAESNHTLKHVFLNCGYSYECEELEMILKINRMGPKEARRKKIALFLEEDFDRMLQIDFVELGKLLPLLLDILAQHSKTCTMFQLLQSFPSEVLLFQGIGAESDVPCDNDYMDVEYLS
ncbi:hypothetical protein ACHAWF_015643 [Thalassiosira exigua]